MGFRIQRQPETDDSSMQLLDAAVQELAS